MKIIVCIKQVPGSTDVEVDPVTGVIKRDGLDAKINPYDLYALECAVSLKERFGGEVAAVTMGPPQSEEILREAMMMGVDSVIMVSDRKFAGSDVLATAYTLSQGIKKLYPYDLIICGKQTTDGDTAQVGSELAEFLNIPNLSNVNKILDYSAGDLKVEAEYEEYIETALIKTPCLISVSTDIGQPRLPSFRLKLKTKNNPVQVYSLSDFEDKNEKKYGLSGSPTNVVKIFPPNVEKKCEVWNECEEVSACKMFEKLVEHKFIITDV